MTVKVAGVWELGYSAPLTEYDLWAFPLRDFGVEEWFMSPVSGIDKRVTEVADLGDAIRANPEFSVVFADEKGEVPLSEFEHPKNALYVLGRAGFSPLCSLGGAYSHSSVRVETGEKKGLLWPHQAIVIILYDRARKA